MCQQVGQPARGRDGGADHHHVFVLSRGVLGPSVGGDVGQKSDESDESWLALAVVVVLVVVLVVGGLCVDCVAADSASICALFTALRRRGGSGEEQGE